MSLKFLHCLVVVMVLMVANSSVVNGQTINDSAYNLDLYYSYTNAGSGVGAEDLEIGNGGAYGSDLFAADFGTFTGGDGTGRIWRITDSNNDGIGEGSVFVSAVGTPFRSPISLAFGTGGSSPFGNNLFMLDYAGSTSQRFVFEANGTGTVTQKSTSAVFNPDGMQAHPDGQRLLVNDASTFTNFGGGDDANILQVSGTGVVTNWANGSNNPNGLWDINSEGTFDSDDWYTLSNHSITSATNEREIVQFKDVNQDGDANDVGESRVLIGLNTTIGQGGAFIFDNNGDLFHQTGNDLYRYTDLNNDNDYWNSGSSTFDAGERFLFAEDLGTSFIQSLTTDGSTIFVGAHNANGTTSIYRISTVPEPSSTTLLVGLGIFITARFRRRRTKKSDNVQLAN